MVEQLATADRPLRIAIVGAGPAGLYAADSLLRRDDLVLSIDIFNRFPTPFGLVRDGVAPDHQSIKAVARIFDKVLADPRVRFFGNVTYGVDLHHRELRRLYHQVVYAVGSQADRRMSIQGEDLPNSLPAIAVVGWYNGHPDYRDLPAVEALLRGRGIDYVTYRDWQLLDRHEVAAGRAQGRPRNKVTTVPEMLAVIRPGPLTERGSTRTHRVLAQGAQGYSSVRHSSSSSSSIRA